MKNEKLYKKQWNTFMDARESPKPLSLIVNDVLPAIAQKKSFLEIGPADGDYTLPLCKYFQHIGIVESNKFFCKELVQKLLESGKTITACNQTWQEAEIGEQKYDLIICSHVLYFVKKENWDTAIKKIFSYRAKGGKIVIMLAKKDCPVAMLGKYFLPKEEFDKFSNEVGGAEDMAEYLDKSKIAYQSALMKANIKKKNTDEFIQSLAVMMMGIPDPEELRKKTSLIDEMYKTDKGYEISETTQVFII